MIFESLRYYGLIEMGKNYFHFRRLRSQKKEQEKAAHCRRWKRVYAARELNDCAREEFAKEYPDTLNPWGQSKEMDDLIFEAQNASPASDRVFYGVTVERCMKATSIQLHVEEGVTHNAVVLAANIISPRDGAPWKWDERALISELENGWLVTLYV